MGNLIARLFMSVSSVADNKITGPDHYHSLTSTHSNYTTTPGQMSFLSFYPWKNSGIRDTDCAPIVTPQISYIPCSRLLLAFPAEYS